MPLRLIFRVDKARIEKFCEKIKQRGHHPPVIFTRCAAPREAITTSTMKPG
jgi:hypothetical protein